MNGYARWAAGVALSLATLAGSATQAASPPPPQGGTIAIMPHASGGYDPAMPAFVDAVSAALNAKGFTILDDPQHAAYVAELDLTRDSVGTGFGKDPHADSVGLAGAGVVVPLSGGQSVVTLRRTRLELRIRKRGDDATVWDGTAMTVRSTGTPKGKAETVAMDLSTVLLGQYPVVLTEVIGVP